MAVMWTWFFSFSASSLYAVNSNLLRVIIIGILP
jgi:hypothetical protein